MTNFEDFKKAAAETAEAIADKSVELAKLAADKTKAIAKMTKLYAEIAGEKDKQRRLYQQIGRAYCELHAADPEEGLAEFVDEVMAAAAAIELKKQEIDSIKAADQDVDVDVEAVEADFAVSEETPASDSQEGDAAQSGDTDQTAE